MLPIADARDFQTLITRKEYFHIRLMQSCLVLHGQDTSPPIGIRLSVLVTYYILVSELPAYVEPQSVRVAGANCDTRDLNVVEVLLNRE